MKILTRRWNDPATSADGTRMLVCRFRPRALPKSDETWVEWHAELGPSRELLAAFHGKDGPPIPWSEYARRYRREMRHQRGPIAALAARARAGETITLLCSAACVDPAHCHRTLLAQLVLAAGRAQHPVGRRPTAHPLHP